MNHLGSDIGPMISYFPTLGIGPWQHTHVPSSTTATDPVLSFWFIYSLEYQATLVSADPCKYFTQLTGFVETGVT